MKRSLKNWCLTLVSILAIVTVFTVGIPRAGGAQDSIRVASKIDTEGSLLGQVIVLLLEEHGLAVEDKTSLGATNVVRHPDLILLGAISTVLLALAADGLLGALTGIARPGRKGREEVARP
mgnify:CR=1 FL=1